MTQLRRTLPEQPQVILDDLGVGLWHVIVPEASTNLITNPSFELGTTGWAASGTNPPTISRVTTQSVFGAASIQSTFAGLNSVLIFDASTYKAQLTNQTVTFSAWVKTTSRDVYLELQANNVSFQSPATSKYHPGGNGWVRLTLTFRAVFDSGGTTTILACCVRSDTNGAVAYVDGAQLEIKPYVTTYIDGDQAGCYWSGLAHGSQSSRPATARQGGRVLPFSRFNWRTTAIVGAQVAALSTITTPYALIGGGYYQRSIAPPRNFSIVGGFDCRSQIELAQSRRELADALSPFATVPDSPVRLVYEPAGCDAATGKRIMIDAVYTGGLEGNQTNDLGIERHALGFRVHLPFAALGVSEIDTATSLDFGDTVLSDTVFRRNIATGELSAVSGFAGQATDAVSTPEGIFIVGRTLSAPDVRVGLWNGSSAVALGGGGLTGGAAEGRAVMRDLDGTIIIGGDFTAGGGVAAGNVVRYNPSSGVWSAMGGGVGNKVYALVLQGGIPWAAGSFASPGPYLAGFDGLGWNGVAGINNTVWTIAARPGTNDIFVGGDFTTPATRFAIYRIGTGWVAAGAGLNNDVRDLVVGTDGALYACGDFTADTSGTTLNYIGRWTGSGWQPLGNGLAGTCESMAFDSNGILYVAQAYRTNLGVSSGTIYSAWDGASWYSPGFESSALPTSLEAIERLGGFDYFIGLLGGYDEAGHTLITNSGAPASPKIIVTGYGMPASIVNLTTGAGIYLDYVLQTGETVTITTGAQPSVISNVAGDITGYLRPSSRIAEFTLIHGVNDIAVFGVGTSVGFSATLVYRETVTSLDQAVR